MKPTSERTWRGALSAPVLTQDLLDMAEVYRHQDELDGPTLAAARPAGVDPSSAYGCVDWYIYPDPSTPNSAGKRA